MMAQILASKIIGRFRVSCIIILFIWISFFPYPIQIKYHLATNIFLLLAFAIVLFRKKASLFKLKDYPLWIFLVAMGINVFFAQQKDAAFKTYLNLFVPMFFIYYLIREDFSNTKRFTLLARTICICSILVSAGGILELLFFTNPLYENILENPYYSRFILSSGVQPMSTQFNPTPLGGYLLGCIPFAFYLYKREKYIFRALGVLGMVLNSTVIGLTLSRSAYLGLMAAIAFYLFKQKNFRLLLFYFIILLMLTYMHYFLILPFNKFGINRLVARGILSNPRIERMNMAMRMFEDHPLAGIGLKHFRVLFYEYYPREEKIPYEFRIADNMYLTILAETGCVGILGFSVFVFSFLKRGWKQLKILPFCSQERWPLLVSLMAFIGLLVSMAGYEYFYWPNQYLLFCIMVGCVSSSLNTAK